MFLNTVFDENAACHANTTLHAHTSGSMGLRQG